jgi:uncharacterized protein (DUF952 family)
LTRIYKVLGQIEWGDAVARGEFHGSRVDQIDGFIHFSAGDQVKETARRYFHGLLDLMVLVVEAEDLGPNLRWEPSRGGALFPHLYGPLRPEHVIEARPAPLGADGVPDLGDIEA